MCFEFCDELQLSAAFHKLRAGFCHLAQGYRNKPKCNETSMEILSK